MELFDKTNGFVSENRQIDGVTLAVQSLEICAFESLMLQMPQNIRLTRMSPSTSASTS
jgi:hypothetical protein